MYAKIFNQIYDGTLCTNGPWEALVTFQQLLILADQEGNVDMTLPAISRRTTIPLDILERGIDALLQEDPHSRTPTEEGRRILPLCEGRAWGWRITNYVHYRQLKREEDRRAYHREYWHKRKSKDSSNDSTGSNDTQHTQPNQPIAYAEAKAEEVKTPRKRGPSASLTFQAWIDSVNANGEEAIPANDPVFAYAEKAHIPADFVSLAWGVFVRKAKESGKKQKSWPQTFRNYVEGNYLKLWAISQNGDYYLTTAGKQEQMAEAEHA
jgi:hypothetical protein